MSATFRLPLPSGNWVRFLFVPVLMFVSTAIDRNYQTDLWHHLARGRAIVAEGRMIDTDRFTYTVADRHFQDDNWLWQVCFYKLHTIGGLELVQTVNSAILFVAMVCLVLHTWCRSGSLKVASAVCVLAFLGVWQLLIIRPQTASFLLFIGLSWLLDEADRRRWLLFFPPVVMALWANLHGGFPTGLLLIGCYALAPVLTALYTAYHEAKPGSVFHQVPPAVVPFIRTTWPWLACLAASVAATGVNPYGYHVYEYVRHTSGIASERQIQEWLPPGMHLILSWFWVLSVLLLMIAFARRGRRPTVQDFVLIFCFLPLACGAVRMVAWWMFICVPILAAQTVNLSAAWRDTEADRKPTWVAALIGVVLLAALVIGLPWLENYNPFLRSPDRSGHRDEYDLAEAVDYLKGEKSGARLYASFEWGEFLCWKQWDDSRVFMDGRIEIYPDAVWDEYWAVRNVRADWQEILDKYGVDFLVLDNRGFHHDLLTALEKAAAKPQTARWREVFGKGSVVIYARIPMLQSQMEPRPLGSGAGAEPLPNSRGSD
jgi:hypothetical protein